MLNEVSWVDMELLGRLLEFIGLWIGIPIGLLLGYMLFIRSVPCDVKDPIVRPLQELDTKSMLDLWPEIPQWVKHPDCDRTDWLNKFVSDMWPYLNKAICDNIRCTREPMFAEYIGKYFIKSLNFGRLTLGTQPPMLHGVKVHESNEKEVILEPAVRWAGNPDITLVLKFWCLRITLQLVDVQVFATLRVVLKPLVPTFPCFASMAVSLLEKPQVDFGLNLFKADVMAIPGLYHYVQETVRKQVASLYLWPQMLEIPILDSKVGATKKPVGILHVKVMKAMKLLKMDMFGASDPYVKLSLSGERIPAKKTTIKMKTLNPVWNESFKLTVKDPQTQVLELRVYDWEKIGLHDKLGMQVVPLRLLSPHEPKVFTLDLLKNQNPNDAHNKRPRGKVVVELKYDPFKQEHGRFCYSLKGHAMSHNRVPSIADDQSFTAPGLLLVTIVGAQDVEGKRRTNPYAKVIFGGEQKKTKIVKRTHDPCWNEEFQFVLDKPPLREVIRVEILSKLKRCMINTKESLGYADIHLRDVVNNEHINHKFHLINSRNGMVHIDIRWSVI